MAGRIEKRLAAQGVTLPAPPPPGGSYTPCRRAGALVHVAGQTSCLEGRNIVGRLGDDISIEDAREAAQVCAMNLLAQLKAHFDGDLDRVVGCVQLVGYVNSTPDFRSHPLVVNGASELILAALGERGRHARAAVGMSSLPDGVAVEVAGIFEFE